MHLGEFIQAVRERGRFSSAEEAERAIHAVFNVFGSRLSIGETEDLVEQLPWRIGDYLLHPDSPEPFGLEEFLRRIAEREGVSRGEAERHARAVLSVLTEAIAEKELDDVLAELPEDLRSFVKAAREKTLSGSSYEI
ncbi:MAG: DUF2267 domain-containing protein [Alphaproteobacteria bacterium]|uniref:DUF2267 domain-containing protein n=1 Tax=Candidatus Nitrobium versatile TaxID=2884831 RepID=A0A953J3W1_9BACT|nr:DUF2267 domain-containing protein [Candidatus Nitrobium versatile]